MMIDKISLINPLPRSLQAADRSRPRASPTCRHANWFGGIYQDPKNFFANMAVDPESWLRIYPGVRAARGAEEGLARRPDRRDRRRRHGEAVRLEGRRPRPLQGDDLPHARRRAVGVHHRRHLRLDGEGHRQDAVLLPLRLPERDDPEPARTAAIRSAGTSSSSRIRTRPRRSRSKLDAMFANSPTETKTATEKAFVAGCAKQIGDIGSIMIARSPARCCSRSCWSPANTMAQAIRERTNELAVLKTLGFSDGRDPAAGAARVVPDRDRRRRARPGGVVAGRHLRAAIPTGRHAAAVLSPGAGRRHRRRRSSCVLGLATGLCAGAGRPAGCASSTR